VPRDNQTQILQRNRRRWAGILSDAEIKNMTKTELNSILLAARFHPKRYQGDIILLRATNDVRSASASVENWRRVISGSVRVHTVPCNHDDMLRPENCAQIGLLLRDQLSFPHQQPPPPVPR
jgi:thioesterase domain-containing protein